MANELENSVRKAAAKIAKYVANVATLTVTTGHVELGADGDANFDKAKPVARTVIKLDGDSEAIVPMRRTEAGGLELDADLLDLHQRNVTGATEYRAQILSAVLGVLKSRG